MQKNTKAIGYFRFHFGIYPILPKKYYGYFHMLTASDTSLTLATWKSIKNKHESSESIFYDVIYHHTIWTKHSTCPGRKKNKKFHVYFWGGNESKFDQTTKWTNCFFFSIVRWIFFHFIMNHWKVRIEEYWRTDHLERDKHKAESLQFIRFVIDVYDSWIASHSMNLDPVSMQTLRNSKAQFSF